MYKLQAKELGNPHVTVRASCVLPGSVKTPVDAGEDLEDVKRSSQVTVQKRGTEGVGLARVTAFSLSEEAPCVMGLFTMGIAAGSANSMAVPCIHCGLVCTCEHANDEGLVQVLCRKCISFPADMDKYGFDTTQGVCIRRGLQSRLSPPSVCPEVTSYMNPAAGRQPRIHVIVVPQ